MSETPWTRAWQRLFPPKVWAAVVYGDYDALPCPMSRLVPSDQILWGDSRNITYREAKSRCAAFNAGENSQRERDLYKL